MVTRSTVVTAAIAAASALAATGITYASAATTEPAHASPVVQHATAPVSALEGGDAGRGNEGKGNNDRGYDDDRRYDDRGHGDRDYYEGRIQINERTYSDDPGGCITVISGLGSNSLNIRNDSRRTIEVFRGATCDNGAPIATVGPHSSSDGVFPGHVRGGVFVHDGVVGSFRVLSRHYDSGYDDDYDGR
ncbi:hypothetical protein ABT126_37790 [Streptomyces sp. NPDC002012]|uniref:hypothetical protein n=1 Tax=Streptomyces sp. NPDC002012 TaxID=3154532 RepID=UPI00333380B7